MVVAPLFFDQYSSFRYDIVYHSYPMRIVHVSVTYISDLIQSLFQFIFVQSEHGLFHSLASSLISPCWTSISSDPSLALMAATTIFTVSQHFSIIVFYFSSYCTWSKTERYRSLFIATNQYRILSRLYDALVVYFTLIYHVHF